MNYEKIYNSLIENKKALTRSLNDGNNYDLHHILPRSLGGTDDEDNLVLLTYKEHFVAHELLVKIYPTKAMKAALFVMVHSISPSHKEFNCKLSARKYEQIKTEYVNSLKKKTVCLETGVIYESRDAANEAVGLSRHSADIVHCFNSNKTAGGFHWAPFEEGVDYTKNEWYGKSKEEKILLIRLEDLKTYMSWKNAAQDVGTTVGAIGYSVNTKGGTARGYHFAKFSKEEDYTTNPYFGQAPELGKKSAKVQCVETGEIFSSIAELKRIKKYDIFKYQEKFSSDKEGLHYVKLEKQQECSKPLKEKKIRIKKIQCVETGEIFNTQREAMKKYNIKSDGSISVAIKLNRKCAGFHWRRIDENN